MTIMHQDYKLRFDEMRSNDMGSREKDNRYASQGHVRKLRFTWPSGETVTMNYAFLIKHDYNPEQGELILYYTTDTIVVKGTGLDRLDDDLFFDIPKNIEMTDSRYLPLDNAQTIVTDIKIEHKP